MTQLAESEVEVLAKRLGLTLSGEELDRLTQCFNGYRDQLEALHRLDLNHEEVGLAFLDPRELTSGR